MGNQTRRGVLFFVMLGIFCWGVLDTQPAESAEKEVMLEMLSTVAGTSAYVRHNAVADMLNKNHPWLKGSVLETASDVERLIMIDEYPPERKARALVGFLSPDVQKFQRGLKPFPKKFTDQRALFRYMTIGFAWITYDPKIKTPADFVGKKIGLFPKMHTMSFIGKDVLKARGVLDKVKLSYHRPPGLKDALSTGVIDVAWVSYTLWSKTNVALSPYSNEIMRARKSYWISVSPSDIDELNKSNPVYTHHVVKAGYWKGGYPAEDTGFLNMHAMYWPHKSMSEKVAYELTKFCDEYVSQHMNEYIPVVRPGDMGGESMVMDPLLTKENAHPGAWKYFKDKGLIK